MIQQKLLLENEFNLICDCLNGIIFKVSIELGVVDQQLVLEIEDSIFLDKLDVKWQVDGKSLIEKLKKFTVEESFKIVEQVYKFWGKSVEEINQLRLKNIWIE